MPLHPSQLEPIEDSKIIERYLRYIVDVSETISFYLPGEDIRFVGLAKNRVDLLICCDLDNPDSAETMKAQDILRKKIGDKLRLNFTLNEVCFFASADILSIDKMQLEIRLLTPILKLQRRGTIRIKVSKSFPCTIEIAGKTYIPYDLSAGGLSIMCSTVEANDFVKGSILRDAKIGFQKKTAPVDLEVTSLGKPKEKEQEIKIGFRFKRLPATMENEIVREAYLYTRKIWARWL